MEALDSECVTVSPAPVKQAAEPGFKWPPMQFIVAGVSIFVALLIAFLLLHSWDNHPPTAGPVGPSTNHAHEATTTSSANLKHVTVDTMDGVAEVYREGKKVGTTPLEFEAHMGDSVEVILRRKGFKELPVQFEVTERREYSFTLEQIK